jgi:glucokinase
MRVQIFPTKDFSTFPDALAEVARQDVFQANIPSAAAFACAGPVQNSKCEMTNLSWIIDGPYLSRAHGIRCFGLFLLLKVAWCPAYIPCRES